MHKLVVFLALGCFGSQAAATTISIQNPCATVPWIAEDVQGTVGQSAGKVTVDTLSRHQFPYIGSDAGINSINGTVTGDAALEVISDSEMRAYGWCYHVNGVEPSVFADQIFIASESDTITWFFGYAHYRDGLWVAMCVPTHIERPRHVCGEGR